MDHPSLTIEAFAAEFRKLKANAEKALAQLADEDFFFRLNEDANSIRVITKHMAGNLVSRFRDFLTTDGEKPDRNRDTEFREDRAPRAETLARWEQGWQTLFDTLADLKDADLSRTVTIRGEPHTVVQALARQLAHHAYHVGQIILIAKHLRGKDWKYVFSIPRGQSNEFNREMSRRFPRT